jgi:hypothetical protein
VNLNSSEKQYSIKRGAGKASIAAWESARGSVCCRRRSVHLGGGPLARVAPAAGDDLVEELGDAGVLGGPLLGHLLLLGLCVAPQLRHPLAVRPLDALRRGRLLRPHRAHLGLEFLPHLAPPRLALRLQLLLHALEPPRRLAPVRRPRALPFLQLAAALHELRQRLRARRERERRRSGRGGRRGRGRREAERNGRRRRALRDGRNGVGRGEPGRQHGRVGHHHLLLALVDELLREVLEQPVVPAALVGAGLGGRPARVAELALLLLLEHLPPLAEALGRAPGHLGGDLLPLVAVLGLQADDQALLFLAERALLNPGPQVVLPPLQARLAVAVQGNVHALRHQVPLARAVLPDVRAQDGVFLRPPPLSLLHLHTRPSPIPSHHTS